MTSRDILAGRIAIEPRDRSDIKMTCLNAMVSHYPGNAWCINGCLRRQCRHCDEFYYKRTKTKTKRLGLIIDVLVYYPKVFFSEFRLDTVKYRHEMFIVYI